AASSPARTRMLMRALGAREIAAGLGILRGGRRSAWMWSRVLGDAMDLALLGSAMSARGTDRVRLGAATLAVAGVTTLDVFTAARLSRAATSPGTADRGIEVVKAITIARTPRELYRYWKQLDNLPRFMRYVESVDRIDETRSRWRVKGPAGRTVEWEAEIIEDRPGECIAWRSLPGADVGNAGRVEFVQAPGGQGTEVRVAMRYEPPAGVVGRGVAMMFGKDPAHEVATDLRRLKQVIETGEVVESDASIHRRPHPAQPTERMSELTRPLAGDGAGSPEGESRETAYREERPLGGGLR
ncbi:MAG TPA: SRPBCC family protein, partial [Kofleriaceae bacterium]|nr:SRPBCC family protein [Kofleriaceae bacterium]